MENQLFTAQQENYLTQIKIPLRLACLNSGGWPVVLSLWYLYRNGQLFCATQASAKVVQYLRQQPRCGFEIAADEPPYCGLRGHGEAEIRADIGHEILEQVLLRYTGGLNHALASRLRAKSANEVAIVITPRVVFTWNYTDRMASAEPTPASKPCPE